MDSKIKNTILALVVVALGLGIYLMVSKKPNTITNNNGNPQVNDVTPPPPGPVNNPIIFSQLSEEENKVLYPPNDQASEEDKAAHINLLNKYAVVTNQLTLTDCLPKPLVVKAQNDSNLTLTNKGQSSLTLSVDGKDYPLAVNQSINWKAGFSKGLGLFGYGCNSETGSGSGLIWVAE